MSENTVSGDDIKNLIQISIIQGGDAFVWSTEWIARLRREFGIVGMLTGSLPLIPQQNVFLGIPLQLFEEEVVYLMRKGVAILVDDSNAHASLLESSSSKTTNEDLREWHQSRQRAIEENKKRAYENAQQSKEKWQKTLANKGEAIERRKERERRREQMRKERREEEEEGEGSSLDLFGSEQVKNGTNSSEVEGEQPWKSLGHPITVPTNSLELPWHHVQIGKNAFNTLSKAAKAGLWKYPSTPDQIARCATFEDLRSKGYFITKGLRFGGDFNVYPGDPLRYHSHFTATIQSSPEQEISAQELVSAGRLSTAVKKAHLLCTFKSYQKEQDEEHIRQSCLLGQHDDSNKGNWGQVDYVSLSWAGFGT